MGIQGEDLAKNMIILLSGKTKGVCSYLIYSNNLISNSYHELKGIDGEKMSIERNECIPT